MEKIILTFSAFIFIFCLIGIAHASDQTWKDWAAFDGLPPDFDHINTIDYVDAGLVRDAVTQAPVKLLIKIRPGFKSPLLKYTALYATVYSKDYGPKRRERFEYSPKSSQIKKEPKGADIIELKKDGGDLYLSVDLHNLVIGSGQVLAEMRDFGPKHRICFAYQSPKKADTGGYLDITVTGNTIDVTLNDGEINVE